MVLKFKLDQPLVVFDLETTGLNINSARIVQFGGLWISPDWTIQKWETLVNPTIPIPFEATAIHGITDADVANAPTFAQIAEGLLRGLQGCNLCGYNILTYDLPLLEEEFKRVNIQFSKEGREIIDVYRIFQRISPHTLEGAVRHWCCRDHENSHNALADCEAALDVLLAMWITTKEAWVCDCLPDNSSVKQMAEFCKPEDWATSDGKIKKLPDGSLIFGFGKYHGQKLSDHPDYLNWILSADFPDEVKKLCYEVLNGVINETPELFEQRNWGHDGGGDN